VGEKQTAITCDNATFAYGGKVVVESLSFQISYGEYLCIVGENGCGKSTLVRGILGLKQPSAGKINVEKGIKRGEIGYLPQQSAVQKDFPAGAYEVVLSGFLSRQGFLPFYSKQDKREARENMERLNISDLAGSCFRELSGGQQQRVLLARAMCAARKLLVLDEPSLGLDPYAAADLYEMISEINRETAVTVIIVSHDIHNAVKYAGKILHISGRETLFESAQEYTKTKVGKRFLERSCPHSGVCPYVS